MPMITIYVGPPDCVSRIDIVEASNFDEALEIAAELYPGKTIQRMDLGSRIWRPGEEIKKKAAVNFTTAPTPDPEPVETPSKEKTETEKTETEKTEKYDYSRYRKGKVKTPREI